VQTAPATAAHPDLQEGPWATQRRLAHLPPPADLVRLLADPAREFPVGLAVRLCHHASEPQDLTLGDLWQAAGGVAAALLAAGVARGERVILVLPTSREFIAAFFGSLLAGCLPVPAAPPASLRDPALSLQLELLRSLAADCGGAACISLPRMLHVLRGSLLAVNPRMALLAADSIAPAPAAFEASPADPDGTAFLQYTSGSTSRPKGVELSHRNVIANASGISERIVAPGLIGFSWLPLYHDMGLIGMLLTALYAHVPVVLMPPQAFVKDPSLWLRGISDFRATVAFNYCVKNLELADLAGVRLDSLRVALNGAEPIDEMAIARFEAKFRPLGLREGVVLPVYGLAESTLAVTFAQPGALVVDEVDADRLEREAVAAPAVSGARRRRFISVGCPIPGQRVRIADSRGRTPPERGVGEILVRGEAVMKGYYRRPADTAAVLQDGWLRTGDLGYLAGGQLYVTGRSKDLLIRHGRNYFPQDIEHQVMQIEGIRKGRVVVFGVEREAEVVVVAAESRQRDAASRGLLERAVRERVHQVFLFGPDEVLLLSPNTIPLTTSGKVRRQECKRLYLSGALAATGRPRFGYGGLLRSVVRSLWMRLWQRGLRHGALPRTLGSSRP
jgi:acyl-CoA synthetase (AMP-forming)/AMP-acid ligase II